MNHQAGRSRLVTRQTRLRQRFFVITCQILLSRSAKAPPLAEVDDMIPTLAKMESFISNLYHYFTCLSSLPAGNHRKRPDMTGTMAKPAPAMPQGHGHEKSAPDASGADHAGTGGQPYALKFCAPRSVTPTNVTRVWSDKDTVVLPPVTVALAIMSCKEACVML